MLDGSARGHQSTSDQNTNETKEPRHRTGIRVLNLASSGPEGFPRTFHHFSRAVDRAWRPEALLSLPDLGDESDPTSSSPSTRAYSWKAPSMFRSARGRFRTSKPRSPNSAVGGLVPATRRPTPQSTAGSMPATPPAEDFVSDYNQITCQQEHHSPNAGTPSHHQPACHHPRRTRNQLPWNELWYKHLFHHHRL